MIKKKEPIDHIQSSFDHIEKQINDNNKKLLELLISLRAESNNSNILDKLKINNNK